MIQFIPNTLLADTNVTAIVGNKIKPVGTNQGETFPYVTFQTVSSIPTRCREGITQETARVQVTCFAETFRQKEELYEVVKQALEGKTDGVVYCQRLNDNDLYRDEADAFAKAIDFQLIKR